MASPQRPKKFFEKIKRNEGFSFKARFFFTILLGSLDPQAPQRPKKFFGKIKRNEGFSFKARFLFTILLGSIDPQNYQFAPKIPENNYQCSPTP